MTTLNDLRITAEVLAERTRQDAKWGQQNHNNLGWTAILTEEVGEAAQASLQADPAMGEHKKTDADVREEVIQSAAVATAWAGAIERRYQPERHITHVYLSGPIAGRHNPAADFAAAAREVRAWPGNHCVVNPFDIPPLDHPHEDCPSEGYFPGDDAGDHTSSCCFMRTDLLALLACDVIYLLPGWESSRGVAVELAVAQACGMSVRKAAS